MIVSVDDASRFNEDSSAPVGKDRPARAVAMTIALERMVFGDVVCRVVTVISFP